MNPYESPQYCDPHLHRMPDWLRRFISTCAILAAIIIGCDFTYMTWHKKMYANPLFGKSYTEIIRTWIEEELRR